jgi:hypothetical protein
MWFLRFSRAAQFRGFVAPLPTIHSRAQAANAPLLEEIHAVLVPLAPGCGFHLDPAAAAGAVGSGDTVSRDVDQAPADLRVMRALLVIATPERSA